jgi:anti-anti-sigma factor
VPVTSSDPSWPAPDVDVDADVVVVALDGEIDLERCRELDDRLRHSGSRPVVDLTGVTLLSGVAIGVLVAHAQRLADEGGRLVVVTGGERNERLLRVTEADRVLDVRHTMPATAAPPIPVPPPARNGERSVDPRDQEIFDLRRKLRTQSTIARAMGVLEERYGLADPGAAFDLLRAGSQSYNLRLSRVAAAFLAAPAPRRPDVEYWFPGRLRQPAPPLTFTSQEVARSGNRATVLDAVLDATAECVDAEMVDLQTAEPPHGDLWMERYRDVPTGLLAVLDADAYRSTAPRLALRRRARVVVPDIATDPVLAGSSIQAVLMSFGSRAMHSSPLPAPVGRPIGVVSAHHTRPGRVPTEAEHRRLDTIVTEAGAWLDWHRRTVMLDALEHVHRSARSGLTKV